MSVKICFKCGIEKSLESFYKHKQMKDGRLNKCKSCNKKDAIKNYEDNSKSQEWVEKERTRSRRKYHRLYAGIANKSSGNKSGRQYKDRYPEKQKAKNSSQRIQVENPGFERHHWSYNEEHYKDIIELSIKDHNKAHRFLVYDCELYMYRTVDGKLLSTKTEHDKYIRSVIDNMPD